MTIENIQQVPKANAIHRNPSRMDKCECHFASQISYKRNLVACATVPPDQTSDGHVKEELEMMVLLKKRYVEEPIPCNLYSPITCRVGELNLSMNKFLRTTN